MPALKYSVLIKIIGGLILASATAVLIIAFSTGILPRSEESDYYAAHAVVDLSEYGQTETSNTSNGGISQ